MIEVDLVVVIVGVGEYWCWVGSINIMILLILENIVEKGIDNGGTECFQMVLLLRLLVLAFYHKICHINILFSQYFIAIFLYLRVLPRHFILKWLQRQVKWWLKTGNMIILLLYLVANTHIRWIKFTLGSKNRFSRCR